MHYGDLNKKDIQKGGDVCMCGASKVVLVGKNPPANPEEVRDMGLIQVT